jgi:hypothetical protein
MSFNNPDILITNAKKKHYRDHIPYRQSKLTHVLRDSLGGNCNTLMIANVRGIKNALLDVDASLIWKFRRKGTYRRNNLNSQIRNSYDVCYKHTRIECSIRFSCTHQKIRKRNTRAETRVGDARFFNESGTCSVRAVY